MGMTDSIADMLTRIRNANRAWLNVDVMPSKMNVNIAQLLKKEGFIDNYEIKRAVMVTTSCASALSMGHQKRG